MKFKISRSIFFKTLSHLQGIVDKKNSLPILANILIEAKDNKLVLSSTDMDISIIEKISCSVTEEGATTINSQILYDIVRKIDDNSEIEIISNFQFFNPAYLLYILNKLVANKAASSPPVPALISTIAFFSSDSSLGININFNSWWINNVIVFTIFYNIYIFQTSVIYKFFRLII